MKLTSRASARRTATCIDLRWTHLGTRYRLTAWPEAAIEREGDGRWLGCEPHEDVLASAAISIGAAAWRQYLEYLPAPEREFVEQFRFGRLPALLVLARCPRLLADLALTPALTSFVAAHPGLRGTAAARWNELRAVHERDGIYGVLEWLGLPASRDVLAALRNLIDADVPRRLLEPLRASLWCPATLAALQRATAISDRQLARFCHPLAA